MKTTRNQSMMAYITLEDDTDSMELLAFSNVLSQFGGYLQENSAVLIQGRISVRDEKEPQLVINAVRLLSDFDGTAEPEPTVEEEKKPELRPTPGQKLWLKLPSEDSLEYRKTKAVLNMFPGQLPVVLYFADTKLRRGTQVMAAAEMFEELKGILGAENVVLK